MWSIQNDGRQKMIGKRRCYFGNDPAFEEKSNQRALPTWLTCKISDIFVLSIGKCFSLSDYQYHSFPISTTILKFAELSMFFTQSIL